MFHQCLNAGLCGFLFMAVVVKTGLTVHLGFSSAISCDDKGGKLGVRRKVCGGMCWKWHTAGKGVISLV